MKVVRASEMRRIEKEAFAEGASEEAFMAAAGRGVADIAHDYVKAHGIEWRALLLCGKGNNAGDAYVAGYRLRQCGFTVTAFQLAPLSQASPLCRAHAAHFREIGGQIIHVEDISAIQWPSDGVVIDGILGTGFHGELAGLYANTIELANEVGLPTIAIDIPSGINGDTGAVGGLAVRADMTVCLGLPKTGTFLPEAWGYVGRLRHIDFGLDQKYIEKAEGHLWLMTEGQAASLLPFIARSRHKYEAGYVLGVAGSETMPGAAILAGEAALRSGAGIVRLFHAPGAALHHCGAPPELIAESYALDRFLKEQERASACFLGPGLGESASLLKELLPKITIPTVIDADALLFLAENDLPLPEKTILTPHRGEMARLLGQELTPSTFLDTCAGYVKDKQAVCIVKGGPTFVFSPDPDRLPLVSPRGDPGMATAGAGDVLTGLLASLLAQGLEPLRASALGVYLHAIAGEIAAERRTSYGLLASDITAAFPLVFHRLIRRQKQQRLSLSI